MSSVDKNGPGKTSDGKPAIKSAFPLRDRAGSVGGMSATQLLQQIENLPKDERTWLFERLCEIEEKDIPESFRQGMAEAERGELMDMDEALKELGGE